MSWNCVRQIHPKPMRPFGVVSRLLRQPELPGGKAAPQEACFAKQLQTAPRCMFYLPQNDALVKLKAARTTTLESENKQKRLSQQASLELAHQPRAGVSAVAAGTRRRL